MTDFWRWSARDMLSSLGIDVHLVENRRHGLTLLRSLALRRQLAGASLVVFGVQNFPWNAHAAGAHMGRSLGLKVVVEDLEAVRERIATISDGEALSLWQERSARYRERGVAKPWLHMALKTWIAIREVLERRRALGFGVNCFGDLIPKGHRQVPCLAQVLAREEGYIAACDGDFCCLASMALMTHLTGRTCTMSNLYPVSYVGALGAHFGDPLSPDPARFSPAEWPNLGRLAHCGFAGVVSPEVAGGVVDLHDWGGTYEIKRDGRGCGVDGDMPAGAVTAVELKFDGRTLLAAAAEVIETTRHSGMPHCEKSVLMRFRDLPGFVRRISREHPAIVYGDHLPDLRIAAPVLGLELEGILMLALGIDCGTSKVAVALVDQGGAPIHAGAQAHHAQLAAGEGRFEQDGEGIARTAEGLVRALPAGLRADVAAIGLTGQMHGVILHDGRQQLRSPLITWQDRRVLEDPGFLRSLPHPRPLHAGYGMATLHWWARQGALAEGLRAATIHGYLAARWCGLERSPIDPTDDQAWGGLAGASGLDAQLLPRQVGHGERIGALSAAAAGVLGIPAGTMVAAPLGDNQASLRATLRDPLHELAFTVGTGCQLAAVMRREDRCDPGLSDLRPYDDAHQLLVAAPLCGGAAWLWLADTAASWVAELGLQPPGRGELFASLDASGLAAADRLDFRPHLAGERHDPALTGSLSGLTLQTGRLGEVARALARGISATARDLLPAAARSGRQRVVASGNALRRSALLRAMAEDELGLPLVLREPSEEAATGAALVAAAAFAAASGAPAASMVR